MLPEEALRAYEGLATRTGNVESSSQHGKTLIEIARFKPIDDDDYRVSFIFGNDNRLFRVVLSAQDFSTQTLEMKHFMFQSLRNALISKYRKPEYETVDRVLGASEIQLLWVFPTTTIHLSFSPGNDLSVVYERNRRERMSL
jgi:hypothetical protein